MTVNPYTVEAGPDLDRLIHLGFMKQSVAAGPWPAYSTQTRLAKQVLTKLKLGKPVVIIGRTGLPGRSWFARYERNAMDGTEVFADTFELAVCRLALLRGEETERES